MKLFIFKPSNYFQYCGGIIIFAAETEEKIPTEIDLGEDSKYKYKNIHKLYLKELDKDPDKENLWVLSKTLNLGKNSTIEAGLVDFHYNYS